jgi:hypothetical protein
MTWRGTDLYFGNRKIATRYCPFQPIENVVSVSSISIGLGSPNGRKNQSDRTALITVTRHGSSLEIGRPRKATIYGHQLVSSPSGAAINKELASAGGQQARTGTSRGRSVVVAQ